MFSVWSYVINIFVLHSEHSANTISPELLVHSSLKLQQLLENQAFELVGKSALLAQGISHQHRIQLLHDSLFQMLYGHLTLHQTT